MIEAVDSPHHALDEVCAGAISCPTTDGVRAGAMIEVVGRLPVNTRAGTIASDVPSPRTSSAVFPKASAAVWAKKFAKKSSGRRFLHRPVDALGSPQR